MVRDPNVPLEVVIRNAATILGRLDERGTSSFFAGAMRAVPFAAPSIKGKVNWYQRTIKPAFTGVDRSLVPRRRRDAIFGMSLSVSVGIIFHQLWIKLVFWDDDKDDEENWQDFFVAWSQRTMEGRTSGYVLRDREGNETRIPFGHDDGQLVAGPTIETMMAIMAQFLADGATAAEINRQLWEHYVNTLWEIPMIGLPPPPPIDAAVQMITGSTLHGFFVGPTSQRYGVETWISDKKHQTGDLAHMISRFIGWDKFSAADADAMGRTVLGSLWSELSNFVEWINRDEDEKGEEPGLSRIGQYIIGGYLPGRRKRSQRLPQGMLTNRLYDGAGKVQGEIDFYERIAQSAFETDRVRANAKLFLDRYHGEERKETPLRELKRSFNFLKKTAKISREAIKLVRDDPDFSKEEKEEALSVFRQNAYKYSIGEKGRGLLITDTFSQQHIMRLLELSAASILPDDRKVMAEENPEAVKPVGERELQAVKIRLEFDLAEGMPEKFRKKFDYGEYFYLEKNGEKTVIERESDSFWLYISADYEIE